MKSFTEYITEKEELEFQDRLDEDFVAIAGTVLGYGTAGLLIAWAGSLLVKGYAKFVKKAVTGISKAWKGIFGKKPKTSEVVNTVNDLKQNPAVKMAEKKLDTERKEFEESLSEVFSNIQEKDADAAAEAFRKSGVKQSPKVNRVVIGEIAKTLGQPPIHYGNTGNEAYLFVKKILGIKVAQAAATVVREALKKQGSELIKDVEKQ